MPRCILPFLLESAQPVSSLDKMQLSVSDMKQKPSEELLNRMGIRWLISIRTCRDFHREDEDSAIFAQGHAIGELKIAVESAFIPVCSVHPISRASQSLPDGSAENEWQLHKMPANEQNSHTWSMIGSNTESLLTIEPS